MSKFKPIIEYRINLPDDKLSQTEYGFYGEVDTYYDDSLIEYDIPLPKYILNKELFKKEYIIDFSNDGIWSNH